MRVSALVCICGHRVTHGGLAKGLLPSPPSSAAGSAPRLQRERHLLAQLHHVRSEQKEFSEKDDPLFPGHLPFNSSRLPATQLPGGVAVMAQPWGEDRAGYAPITVVTKTTGLWPEPPKMQ